LGIEVVGICDPFLKRFVLRDAFWAEHIWPARFDVDYLRREKFNPGSGGGEIEIAATAIG